MFSCLGLSSCAFFCVFCFVYCRDFFLVEKFPVQRPDRRVVYCNGLFYVFPTRNIVNFLINFTFSTATYLSMARYSLFMLKVSLYPSQLNMQYTLCQALADCIQYAEQKLPTTLYVKFSTARFVLCCFYTVGWAIYYIAVKIVPKMT